MIGAVKVMTINDDNSLLTDTDANGSTGEAHVLYHASMLLKGKISSVQDSRFHGLLWVLT